MEILILVWVGCALLCWGVANSKERFAFGWLILGLFLGVFALIALVALPSLARDKNAQTPETHVKCPDCRQLVPAEARVCYHCQCTLVPQNAAAPHRGSARAEQFGRKVGRLFAKK